MALQFSDHLGRPVPFDGRSPVTWRVSVYTVVVRDDHLLLIAPAYSDDYDLPGGRVESGETLVEAAARECLEETGYRFLAGAAPPVYLGEQWFSDTDAGTYHHGLFLAIAGTVDPDPDPDWRPIPGETERVLWLPLADVATAPIHSNHRPAVAGLV